MIDKRRFALMIAGHPYSPVFFRRVALLKNAGISGIADSQHLCDFMCGMKNPA